MPLPGLVGLKLNPDTEHPSPANMFLLDLLKQSTHAPFNELASHAERENQAVPSHPNIHVPPGHVRVLLSSSVTRRQHLVHRKGSNHRSPTRPCPRSRSPSSMDGGGGHVLAQEGSRVSSLVRLLLLLVPGRERNQGEERGVGGWGGVGTQINHSSGATDC